MVMMKRSVLDGQVVDDLVVVVDVTMIVFVVVIATAAVAAAVVVVGFEHDERFLFCFGRFHQRECDLARVLSTAIRNCDLFEHL